MDFTLPCLRCHAPLTFDSDEIIAACSCCSERYLGEMLISATQDPETQRHWMNLAEGRSSALPDGSLLRISFSPEIVVWVESPFPIGVR